MLEWVNLMTGIYVTSTIFWYATYLQYDFQNAYNNACNAASKTIMIKLHT